MKQVDVIIIGQGLAGSLLALECIQRGFTVQVLDNGQPGSSYAAAGLFNPITGRKMVKTWKADVLFDFLMHHYSAMESILNATFFHNTPIFRPFVSVEEYNDWHGRWADPEFAPYIREVTSPRTFAQHCYDDFGGILLQKTGWVDLPKFLKAVRSWLKGQSSLTEADYQPEQLELDDNKVTYGELEGRWMVSCTGTQATKDNHWSWLPFRPVKGEVLELETQEDLPRIYNRGVFVLPTETNTVKVGSTYHHQELSLEPTERGKNELLEKLNALLRVPFSIKAHWAGIRPATKDRRPIIGQHPKHNALWICNGLGAKGVSLGPFFVKQLADALFLGQSLWPEVDIQRFGTYYNVEM
ncbi:MAG TPA: glycine oxidase [Cytophagales bacterium]|nr:glycine oxidase [Cytophagales bacterium]HAP58599.1 glycine oxidase [Cytophagales bacterium]